MIQLEFKSPSESIRSMAKHDLPKFSLLTGLNGTGKTHLLRAIQLGRIEIKGSSTNEIVYFDYKSFQVNPDVDSNSGNVRQLLDKSNKAKANLYNEFNQNLSRSLNSLSYSGSDVRSAMLRQIRNLKSASFPFVVGNEFDFQSLAEQNDISKVLAESKDSLSPAFIGFLQLVAKQKIDTSNITMEGCQRLFDSVCQDITDAVKNFFRESQGRLPYQDFDLNELLHLSLGDFETTDLLAAEIAEEVKTYILERYLNNHSRLEATEYSVETSYLTSEEFETKYGPNPLLLFNSVLQEYDCNGYLFNIPTSYPRPDQDWRNTKLRLSLSSTKKDVEISISSLSSGEQTLLSLALLVYKARKGKILPSVLLLDEIDAALHPTMIGRLMEVIRKVFVESHDMKVIMVTHSPTTVAQFEGDYVHVVTNETDLIIEPKPKSFAVDLLTDGFATLDRGLTLVDQISKASVVVLTEGKNTEYLKKANEFFGSTSIEIVSGIEGRTGKDQLRTIYDFLTKIHHSNSIFVVWDCDVSYQLDAENNCFPVFLPKNPQNKKVLKGIENMFSEDLFESQFYTQKPKDDGGIALNLNKNKFQEYILKHGDQEAFKNFKPLFEQLLHATRPS